MKAFLMRAMPKGKTLFLVRHAKSSWVDSTLSDLERPLSTRGKRDAIKLGKHWTDRADKPDLIVSSPAERALATARLVAQRCGYAPADIVVDARLYGGSATELVEVVEGLNDRCAKVVLVGHNPEFTDLASRFCGAPVLMPTCTRAEFRFDAEHWSAIGHSAPRRARIRTPKRSA